MTLEMMSVPSPGPPRLQLPHQKPLQTQLPEQLQGWTTPADLTSLLPMLLQEVCPA